ncbi:MAG TPA: DUF2218 domain-containing protein [Steroidobacteraceae bacterium]|nr:DUF2218 domain-containing protein [Steroidobacteraceae bacterium]
MRAHADISTASGSRTLVRLSKHWEHGFSVNYTPDQSDIRFDADSSCRLLVVPQGLHVEIEARTEQGLGELERVVAEHLQRMSRGEPLTVEWVRSG